LGERNGMASTIHLNKHKQCSTLRCFDLAMLLSFLTF
jgi:hypothetical protein